MRYAIRDPQGAIVSLHREPVPGAEPMPVQHPEVQAFLGSDGERSFAQMDANLVRVLEDLIDVLVQRTLLAPGPASAPALWCDDSVPVNSRSPSAGCTSTSTPSNQPTMVS